MSRCVVVWFLASSASLTVPVFAIELHADFDHASLDVANSSTIGADVQLVGRDNHNPGDWKWLYFSAADVLGQTPKFVIGDNFETGSSSLLGHKMVYSYDQQTWHFFENNVLDTASDTFTFWNDSPYTEPEVFVAYGLPYPLERVAAHTSGIATSPWLFPTNSADESFVIGQSPGGTDDLGRSIVAHDLIGYRIADPQGSANKSKVVLAGGVHANETLGNFVLEGLVDFLVGATPEAELLRKYADFYVYPMINPDGRFAGYNRSTVADEPLDPNRYWAPSEYGGIAEIGAVATAMFNDVSDADYLIDFHSTVNGKTGHYGFVLPSMQSDPLWQAILEFEPEIDTRNALLVNDTTAKFGRDQLGADFSITFETQFLPDENIDRFLDLGRNFGLAFGKALTLFGDLDLNGQLGLSDYEILTQYAESDLSSWAPIDAYLRGDLDGDGQNNLVDFGIFKQALEDLSGLGAFARLLAAVPEPSTVALLGVAIVGLVLRSKRTHLSTFGNTTIAKRVGADNDDQL